MLALTLREDMHVRISASKLDKTITRSVRRARRAGLSRIACVIDPAGLSDAELPAFLTAIERLRQQDAVVVHAAVEARLVDERGTLSLPDDIAGIDYVYTKTDEIPVGEHSYSTGDVQRALSTDELSNDDVIEHLVNGLCCAMVCNRTLVLASPFAVLDELGLSEADLSDCQLTRVTDVARETDTALAVTERSREPSLRVVRAFLAAGVSIFVGTGTERPSEVGRYDYCSDLAKMVGR